MNEIKKFMAFGGLVYYPSGGMSDCLKDYDDLESAKNCIVEHLKTYKYDPEHSLWGQIWDTETGNIVDYKYGKGKLIVYGGSEE